MVAPQYIIQLINYYGKSIKKLKIILKKVIRNFRWHLTPTEEQIKRLSHLYKKHNITCTYFVTADLLARDPLRLKNFKDQDVAPHGYGHLRYSTLDPSRGHLDLSLAISTFRKVGYVPLYFRAPYANPVFKSGPSWYEVLKENGVQISSSVLNREFPFRPYITKEGVLEFPILYPTDDGIIEDWGKSNPVIVAKELLRPLYKCLRYQRKSKNPLPSYITYCLHPLRMGQIKYLGVVKTLIKFVEKNTQFRFVSLKEAIELFKNEREERSSSNSLNSSDYEVKELNKKNNAYKKDKKEIINYVIITGDIDCWTYVDYIRRLRFV